MNRNARAVETPVLPPLVRERVFRGIYLAMGTVPLVAVVFLPLPAELDGLLWLWLSAGGLLTARVWLRDFSLRRLTRFSRFAAHRQAIYLVPFVVLIYTPAGGRLAGLWREVPYLVGATGGVVAACATVAGWHLMESDFQLLMPGPRPVRVLLSVMMVPGALFRAVTLRGTVPFLLVVQVLPDPPLLTTVVCLLGAELVVLAIDTFVTGGLRLRLVDASQFPGHVDALGDYIVGSWAYDAVMARPNRPDYSFIATLASMASFATFGFLGMHKLSSRAVVSGLKQPADVAFLWLEYADFALDVVESKVLPLVPARYTPVVRRDHWRARADIAVGRANAYHATSQYERVVTQQFAAAEAFDKAGLPDGAAWCRCRAAETLHVVFHRPHEAIGILVEIIQGGEELSILVRRNAVMLAALCLESLGQHEEAAQAMAAARTISVGAEDADRVWKVLSGWTPPLLNRYLRRHSADIFRINDWMLASPNDRDPNSSLPVDHRLLPPEIAALRKATDLLRQGDSRRARREALRSVRLSERCDNVTNLGNAHRLLADLAEDERDWASRFRHLMALIDASETRRSRVLSPANRTVVSTRGHRSLIWLLTDPHRNRGPGLPERPYAVAFDVLERYRSRVLLEVLDQSLLAGAVDLGDRVAGIADPEGAALTADRGGRPMNYAEVRHLLEDIGRSGHRVLLAEYFRDDAHTTIFLARADYADPVVLTVEHRDRERWQEAIRPFRDSTESGMDPDTWDEQFRRLVGPLAEHSAEGDLVWLVLDDELHYLPLHAVAVDGRPLADRNPVCVTPNASVMRYCLSRGPGSPLRSGLLLADSIADRPLVHARMEARAIAEALPDGGEVYVGAEATRSVLTRRLAHGRHDVLHIACHGVYDHTFPMGSGILLAPSPEDGAQERRLTAEELMSMRLPVQLVTLSACGSGLGDTNEGDEYLGLVRALLQTGTPSLLVSLWSVDEISSSFLMQAFYRAVGRGQGRAEALRAAQRTVRTTTVGEVLAYCEDAMVRLDDGDEAGRLALRWDIADLLFRARDFPRALAAYEALSEDVGPHDADRRRVLIAAARCRRAAAAGGMPVDYGVPAFDHPYHWAAFQLVGDWR